MGASAKDNHCLCGLDVLRLSPPAKLKSARLGLLTNPAGCARDFTPAWRILADAYPGQLQALFGPQHGFLADKQDNMVETSHSVHPELNIPVYSLYGETRRPLPHMLKGLDALLIDMADMGCRVYTFFSTVLACLEEAAQTGLEVWILDRPNPLGRGEEGPVLKADLFSFVGPYAMPLRHGLTLGELALLARTEKNLDLKLTVVPLQNWQERLWPQTGLNWIMPSPNLPTWDSAAVYPGQVLWEGTTLSEGRGTTRPFEIFGVPGLNPNLVLTELAKEPEAWQGVFLRPLFFEPTFHKYAGRTCGGFQIHVQDHALFKPVRLSLALMGAINRAQPGLWRLRQPPYEYEYEKRPLDLLLGDPGAVDLLAGGAFSRDIIPCWQDDLALWRQRVKPCLLYGSEK